MPGPEAPSRTPNAERRRPNALRYTLPALAVLLLAPAVGARADRFRYQFRAGQVIRTEARLAGASMMGQTAGNMAKMRYRATLMQTQRVRSVAGGAITLEITEVPVSGTVTAMGRTEPYKKTATKSIVKMTERGRVLSRKTLGEKEDSGMDGTDALYGLNFPDRDLKPGDTWEDTVPVGQDAKPVRLTSKFLGWETFRGRRCARFYTTLSVPESVEETQAGGVSAQVGNKVSATVTTYFDPKTGTEVYSKGSMMMIGRADLTSINPEAGELATVSKINFVQALAAGRK